MANGIERPLDMLNQSRGKEILLQLKNDKQIRGKLLAFDIHINVVLDNAKELENNEIKRSMGLTFVRGDTIIFISPASTTASEGTAEQKKA
jgi:small nuclear ribonucleoprotein